MITDPKWSLTPRIELGILSLQKVKEYTLNTKVFIRFVLESGKHSTNVNWRNEELSEYGRVRNPDPINKSSSLVEEEEFNELLLECWSSLSFIPNFSTACVTFCYLHTQTFVSHARQQIYWIRSVQYSPNKFFVRHCASHQWYQKFYHYTYYILESNRVSPSQKQVLQQQWEHNTNQKRITESLILFNLASCMQSMEVNTFFISKWID